MNRPRTEIEADDFARTVNRVARSVILAICVALWIVYDGPPYLFLGLIAWAAFWAGEDHDAAIARRRFRRMGRRRVRREEGKS